MASRTNNATGASTHISTQASELASQIDQRGFAVIDDYIPEAWLRTTQRFVSDTLAKNDGNYICFTGPHNLSGNFLSWIATDVNFIQLCRSIYTCGTGLNPPNDEFYQVLRCLSGSGAKEHSLRFHYDSYVLTALIPIIIPTQGERGNLIVLPNTRRIRKMYISNFADKVLVDNKLSQLFFRTAYKKRHKRIVSVELRPGSLYFFWGYRSLHTNEPCSPTEIRSTALLHYVDPHAESRLKMVLRGVRNETYSWTRSRAYKSSIRTMSSSPR